MDKKTAYNIGYTKSGQCFADSLVLNLQVHSSVGSSVEARLRVAVKRYTPKAQVLF